MWYMMCNWCHESAFPFISVPSRSFWMIFMTSAGDQTKKDMWCKKKIQNTFLLHCAGNCLATQPQIHTNTPTQTPTRAHTHTMYTPISPGFKLWCDAVLSLPRRLHQGLSQDSSPAATDILSGPKDVCVCTHTHTEIRTDTQSDSISICLTHTNTH